MNVLVACEFSGIVRDAFIAKGHNAVSCDLEPTERPGPHFQCDAKYFDGDNRFDLIIAHPPCTYLCNSGVRWLTTPDYKVDMDRWNKMLEAAAFFRMFLNHICPKVAVENPIMHLYAVSWVGRNYDFKIQPWQFGHPETKTTCFWTKGLPPLEPTNIVSGRRARVHREPPSPNRQKNRSRTYEGIAKAMAEQWG